MTDRLAQLTRLHETDRADPFVTYGIALEHLKAGDPRQAIDWLDRTLTIDPHYHYAYFQKAKALTELGREDDARRTLDAGIADAKTVGHAEALHAAEEMRQLRDSL